MKQGSQPFLPLSFLLGLFLIFTPFTTISAQDEEDDAVEEIFWGDEEEDDAGFDEDFDFSEDEGEDDLEGFEFEDDEGFDDEFTEDDEFFDDEGEEDFSDDFADEPEESIQEAASRLGYTLNIIGSSPGFVNHQLRTYNSGVDFRAAFEFPMLLSLGPVRFRLGAEVGTFKFTNYKPIGGTYSGVHVTGIYPSRLDRGKSVLVVVWWVKDSVSLRRTLTGLPWGMHWISVWVCVLLPPLMLQMTKIMSSVL